MTLVIVMAILIVVGMFIESNAAYIMLVPLFAPVALTFGVLADAAGLTCFHRPPAVAGWPPHDLSVGIGAAQDGRGLRPPTAASKPLSQPWCASSAMASVGTSGGTTQPLVVHDDGIDRWGVPSS